ncbi:MAG: hypothetical protein WEK74_12650 [Hydrogenophaga sp.]
MTVLPDVVVQDGLQERFYAITKPQRHGQRLGVLGRLLGAVFEAAVDQS